jgi:hypothetical protein
MAKDNSKLVLVVGGLAVAYFGIVKPAMAAILPDNSAANDVNDLQAASDADNPFSPNFGTAYSEKTGANADYIEHSTDFIANNYKTLTPKGIGPDENGNYQPAPPYVELSEKIYRAMGYFWIDLAAVEAAFANVTSQYEVCQMSQWLLYTYNIDLLKWLKHGQSLTPWDNGIGTEALDTIIKHVKTLPFTSAHYPGSPYDGTLTV